MNNKANTKLMHLIKTFNRNYKITKLYSDYLTLCPELITAEMINALTEDGSISKEEALRALVAEIFKLDFDNGIEDRILIRDYVNPSIRILDRAKYENDPYYKNIKLKNVKDGAWEIRMEKYAPYRAVICDDLMINEDLSEIPPLGFFTEEFVFPAVLENGNEWMTLTPVDLDTCEEAIKEARGKVVTFGLGLGYYAYMASEKAEVDSVTVVEKSPQVINLFKKYILPQFTHPEKITVVECDAFEYAEKTMPSENFDLAFVDTWRDASDGAPMYKKMKALEPLSENTKFMYWIERFLVSRLRAIRFEELWEKVEKGEINEYDVFLKMLNSYL